MNHYQYLIIGGGLAGDAAVRGIRELDGKGSICLISQENDPPYMRPNLSKGLWKGRPIEKIWRNTQNLGAELQLGRKISYLDPESKTVRDERGNETTYNKILLATGGTPIHLPFGSDRIIYFRNFQDYKRLRALTERGDRFLVIGGGFIGSEIAAALTMTGNKVVMVFPEEGIGANIFPKDLAQFLNGYYRQKGIELLPGEMVVSLDESGEQFKVGTKSGRAIEVDGVVAGIGLNPNIELAQQAGLLVEDGIIVNERLQTSSPEVFAAGDAANFFNSALGKRVRVEHEDNAIKMGKLAGRNMAGADESYTHIPMFYSDIFELGYEAVGEINSKMEMVSDWQDSFNKGVVYYLADNRLRGVLLWNVWDSVPAARAMLIEPGPFKPAELIGRL